MKRKEIYHREDVWKVVLLVVLLTFRCSLFTASAQDDETMMRDVYAQAENDYRIGRTEQARDLLLQHLKGFDGNLRQSALRLIALSYLESFDIKQTEHYASMILEQNPYYTVSAQDPPEFADIVNQIKAGMTATVTTASNISESLDEVPVPTTLITEEMIAASGGRNLQEVLAAYVPGISLVDCNNDINVSMRSIHSSTQEKMLFMLNGHRLNSYLTNTAAPDFSISLEKVKQIEVLRGPASSLNRGLMSMVCRSRPAWAIMDSYAVTSSSVGVSTISMCWHGPVSTPAKGSAVPSVRSIGVLPTWGEPSMKQRWDAWVTCPPTTWDSS